MARPRAITFYLPLFHPAVENDTWSRSGFTEWTNTAKERPSFGGHAQPHIPANLGFYDRRVAETRKAQAALARRYGIKASCYYHYWFAGRRMRPSQKPAVRAARRAADVALRRSMFTQPSPSGGSSGGISGALADRSSSRASAWLVAARNAWPK
jgi:Glycosyltransferase WbsX